MNKQIIAKQLVRIARNLIASHRVFMRQFPEKTTLKQMRDVIDDNMINVYDPGQTDSGMASNLKLYARIFESKREAQRFLDGYASHYQDCGARFKSPVKNEKREDKFYLAINKECERLRQAVFNMVKCPNCRSVLNMQFYRNKQFLSFVSRTEYEYTFSPPQIWCPVCGQADLMKIIINSPKVKKIIDKINAMIEEKRQKQKQGKFELKWLVIAHRHV